MNTTVDEIVPKHNQVPDFPENGLFYPYMRTPSVE